MDCKQNVLMRGINNQYGEINYMYYSYIEVSKYMNSISKRGEHNMSDYTGFHYLAIGAQCWALGRTPKEAYQRAKTFLGYHSGTKAKFSIFLVESTTEVEVYMDGFGFVNRDPASIEPIHTHNAILNTDTGRAKFEEVNPTPFSQWYDAR